MKIGRGSNSVAGGYPAGRRGSLGIPCPKCLAGPGQRCKSLRLSSRSYRATAHDARIAAWRKEER